MHIIDILHQSIWHKLNLHHLIYFGLSPFLEVTNHHLVGDIPSTDDYCLGRGPGCHPSLPQKEVWWLVVVPQKEVWWLVVACSQKFQDFFPSVTWPWKNMRWGPFYTRETIWKEWRNIGDHFKCVAMCFFRAKIAMWKYMERWIFQSFWVEFKVI